MDCPGTISAWKESNFRLNCSCRSAHSTPDCDDANAPSQSSKSGKSRSSGGGKGGLSFDQQIGLSIMEAAMRAILSGPSAAPPEQEAPPPPPQPEYAPNPVYDQALKKFEEFRKPDSELRRALVDQLSGVPRENLPPRTPALPKQLLLSACLGQAAKRSSNNPLSDDDTALLLRQSAQAMQGMSFDVSMKGCDIPEPPLPGPAVVEKRLKAAELAADLFARAGELKVRSAQAGEKAVRAQAALAEAEKKTAEPTEDKALLAAAREAEAAARRELEQARADAERLKREAEEAAKKGRGAADRLNEAGNDEGRLDGLFTEFGDGR
ncbi:MAG: hypothetical protein HY928_18280 [Elusimicrobia bacterium]|nr:hypothetical protein [Elusimicrobiota bacterium]